MKASQLIKRYIEKKHLYEKNSKILADLLEVLLQEAGINYQKIEHRTKKVRSLEGKIYRKQLKNKEYENLDQISDLSGIRVIVFFKDDIERVAKLIEKEFEIHKDENVDMDNILSQRPREFGYLSKHRIVSISKSRKNLKEYKKYKDLKAEIQIRTVLQHAWAEIEHDIGYKPQMKENEYERIELTRIFSQNAALLEIADDNFVKIKKLYSNLLNKYKVEIDQEQLDLPLNIDSLKSYFKKDYQTKDQFEEKNLETQAFEEFYKARSKGIKSLKEFDKDQKSKK